MIFRDIEYKDKHAIYIYIDMCVCIRNETYAFIVGNAVKYSWSGVCHWWMTGFINIDMAIHLT